MPAKNIFSRLNINLRYKLLLLVLLPIFIVMPIVLGLVAYWSEKFSFEQLIMKVNTDLSVTHEAFYHEQDKYLSKLERLGESYSFRTRLYEKDIDILNLELQTLKEQSHFDYLHLIDLNGNWLYETPYSGYTHSKRSVLFSKAKLGDASSGIEIFTQEDLAREKSIDRNLLRLTLIETSRAKPIQRNVEDRGMMLRMLYPVRGATNKVVAFLDGGVLLNRNFELVDRIRDLVYGTGSLIEGSLGTVTIFLNDVRISTNVPSKSGARALGTRVSEDVRSKVMGEGSDWINRAFVVNNWYISAYEPIYDVGGDRVGILYAGFLETPFTQIYRNALLVLVVLFIIVMLFSSWFAILGAKSIFRPIEQMTAVVRATYAGQQLRIGNVETNDEIGELARQFDSLLDQIHERNIQVIHAAEVLEQKVEERTLELKTKNITLKNNIDLLNETRKQLVLAEKLASLGELTAGIAHEINNPTAVILGNMELIISELGSTIEPVKFEAQLIIEQVYRIRTIIESLLKYSRKNESSEHIETINVNTLIELTLPLVKHEVEAHKVGIELDLHADIPVRIRKQELQQVLINMIVNAVQASSEKFERMYIETQNWEEKGVVIKIKDYGAGISEDVIDQIFDPFHTTKVTGTGLGLSVSYGLVQRYGGSITVENNLSGGVCFSVWLLQQPELHTNQ